MTELDELLEEEHQTQEAEEPAPEPEQEPEEVQAEAEAEPEEAEEPEQPKATEVPINALLDEREKRKALEAKLAEIESKQASQPDLNSFLQPLPEQIPDQFDDAEGFQKAMQQYAGANLHNSLFAQSVDSARRTLGAEKVNQAMLAFDEAAKNQPILRQALEGTPNPAFEIVDWYEQQQFVAQRDTFNPVLEAGGLDKYMEAQRAEWEKDFLAKQKEAEPEPGPQRPETQTEKPAMPKSFNQGGKGGANSAPIHDSLDDLLA